MRADVRAVGARALLCVSKEMNCAYILPSREAPLDGCLS